MVPGSLSPDVHESRRAYWLRINTSRPCNKRPNSVIDQTTPRLLYQGSTDCLGALTLVGVVRSCSIGHCAGLEMLIKSV